MEFYEHPESSDRPTNRPPDNPEGTGFEAIIPSETGITPGGSALEHVPEVFTADLPEVIEPANVAGHRQGAEWVPFVEQKKMTPHETRAAEICAKIMGEVGSLHNEEGIDVAKVGHYAGALGLQTPKDYIVVDRQHVFALRKAMARAGAVNDALALQPSHEGEYMNDIGLTVVIRQPDADPAFRGTVTFPHEHVGHGSAGIQQPRIVGIIKELTHIKPPEIVHGLNSHTAGYYLEEGFAHLTATEYGRHAGDGDYAPNWTQIVEENQHAYNRIGHDYDTAQIGLALLFERQPDLLPAIIESRTDPALRDVKGLINSIQPGLFQKLIPVIGEDTQFRQATADILHATGFSVEDVPGICNSGQATTYFREKVEAYERVTGYRFRTP